MDSCIFCQIIKGEISCQKVYEDDQVFAFLDINPGNFGHTLIVPKKHFKDLLDAPEEILTAVIIVAQKIGQAVIKNLGADGFNLELNNGRPAGQIVDHFHLHIIPRFSGDNIRPAWSRKEYKEGEMEEYANKIREAL